MRSLLLVVCCLMMSVASRADHLFGGELYYVHLSGNTYKISLALYGDCASTSSAFAALSTATPTVLIKNGTIQIDTLHLNPELVDLEITPVCRTEVTNTSCTNPSSVLPGIKKYIYSREYTLPDISDQWIFAFAGEMNNNSFAGRTTSITNISQRPGGGVFTLYLEAHLSNFDGANSSPQFTSIPTPFYCINILQEYNQGAVDSENDSLAFVLSPALDGGNPVLYSPGYSAENPLSTLTGFEFNDINGQIRFIPDATQKGVVVNKVEEYRNGKLVGSCMREMTFIVLDNCNNLPVGGKLDTLQTVGGLWSSGNILNVCVGTAAIDFRYDLSDPDGDTVDISVAGLPSGANLTIHDNGTVTPYFNFSWNGAGLAPGNYTFYVTAKDRHCPISTSQTRGFTIRVVEPYEITHVVTEPTDCYHKAVLRFAVSKGISPRVLTVKQGDNILSSYPDTSGVYVDSFYAGSYLLEVSSPQLLCSTRYNFQVADSGIFPFLPQLADDIVCLGEDPAPLRAIGFPGATILWYDLEGNALPQTPIPNTSNVDTQSWMVSQQYKVCESDRRKIDVFVAPKPSIRLYFDTGIVCIGEKVYLQAEGASAFIWLPEGEINYEPDQTPFIRVYQPATYTVVGKNKTGCADTVSFGYHAVEPCCNFSYPNAFSPNNDGHNDKWRPVMYGNDLSYELSIFNRWGVRLFHSFIANEGWDGSYRGEPQEIGTYFYILKAKCITGREETRKGAFTLIR